MRNFAIVVLVLLMLGYGSMCFGADNYFLARYGVSLEGYPDEKYFIYESNALDRLALGGRVVAKGDGYMLFNPYGYWKFSNGFQIGLRYQGDSKDNDFLAPGIRIRKDLGGWFLCLDVAEYLDLQGDQDKFDSWVHISTTGLGWYCGAEAWYYHASGGTHNFNFRPAKIGYRFNGLPSPFVMFERHWDNNGGQSDAIYGGIELCY